MLEQYAHNTKINFTQGESPIESRIPCGIDIGYSAIKVKSPYNESVIPSIVRRVTRDAPLLISDDDIRYSGEDGRTWYVGSIAKKSLTAGNTAIKKSTMLGRQRIQSHEFLVQIRVALFFASLRGLTEDGYERDTRALKIQTGLPPEFIRQDSALLKDRFAGTHTFRIKIGKRPWVKVTFEIGRGDVYVCKQPFGTLMSCVMNNQGEIVNDALLTKNLLVLDPGFHSVDTYHCLQGAAEGESLTWENYGMQAVFQRTCDDILKNTKNQADIDVYGLEQRLRDGFVYYGPRKEKYFFEMDFMKNLKEVCLGLLDELNTTYNNMMDVDVLILTGGTGAAWEGIIRDEYKDMGGLEILTANEGKDIVCANVEGYYNLLVSRL